MGSMLFMLPYMVFGGYFVNLNSIYVWLRWMNYLSPIRYSMEALLRNELENNSNYNEADQIYKSFHYNFGMWWSILMLLVLAISFRAIALIALRITVVKIQ